jgi:hypothetical protein
MSAKKPTIEELWERAGYLRAASTAAEVVAESMADTTGPGFINTALEAYVRGMERWKAEHPEVRA